MSMFTPIPDETQLVDIRYAGGVVVASVEPGKRRWTITGSDFDIAEWRPSGETAWRANPLLNPDFGRE